MIINVKGTFVNSKAITDMCIKENAGVDCLSYDLCLGLWGREKVFTYAKYDDAYKTMNAIADCMSSGEAIKTL